jgi:argininosuccinate lyase
LSEIVGKDIGGKLHTGRSRNDQTATDARLWLVSNALVSRLGLRLTWQMKEAKVIQAYLKELIAAMVERADSEIDALMPGYTHLQVREPMMYWG